MRYSDTRVLGKHPTLQLSADEKCFFVFCDALFRKRMLSRLTHWFTYFFMRALFACQAVNFRISVRDSRFMPWIISRTVCGCYAVACLNQFTIVKNLCNYSAVYKFLVTPRIFQTGFQRISFRSQWTSKPTGIYFTIVNIWMHDATDAKCKVVPRWRRGYAVACRATITPVQIWTLA